MPGAPRHLFRLWPGFARGAWQAAGVWLAAAASVSAVSASDIATARYTDPTPRYAHGVLGDAIEWGALEIAMGNGDVHRFVLPQDHVFEDVAPRVADLDQDGDGEIVVVETDMSAGAALAVYDQTGKIAETPHIGTRNRWLAPFAAGDIDGDGVIEIAYIDRPHLAKTLRIWRFENNGLTQAASLPGLTNHRIGEADIAGGIRSCGAEGPEMILASANWADLVAVRWDGTTFSQIVIGNDTSRAAFAQALACD